MSKAKRIAACTLGQILLLSVLTAGQCKADSFTNLQDARSAAWDELLSEKGQASDNGEKGGIPIDGAVDEDGRCKVIINDWKNKAITEDDGEIKVYPDSESDRAVGKIYKDTIVTVLEDGEKRIRIESGKLTGYVDKDQLIQGDKAKERIEKVCPLQVVADIYNIEIRKAAEENSAVIAHMLQRMPYMVIGKENGFFCIQFKTGENGYVRQKDVTQVREVRLGTYLKDEKDPQKPYRAEDISEDDRTRLAAIIFCESRGEPFDGQIAVGNVVMNRVYNDLFPDTISEVIYAEKQFEPTLTGWYDSVLEEPGVITYGCYEAADAVIQGVDIVGDALYFGYGDYGKKIGDHWFH